MHLDVTNAGAVSVLKLPANLSRSHAEMLKTYLRRSLDCAGRLIVDCEQVAFVDPDCLRILCSAYRLSKTMHKDFVVAGQHPGLFLRVAKEADYVHCMGCGLETDSGCLWGMR